MISGALLDNSLSGQVWIDEEVDRFDITNGTFRVEGPARDTLDLQFSTSDGETGRMRILGLPGGSDLTLDGIWFEGGIAFAMDAATGNATVHINGLRMGSLAGVSEGESIGGTVLALDEDERALIIRPADGGLPDLRIVISDATAVEGAENIPSTLERLQFGDSITVAGEVEGRYLLASRVIVPVSRSSEAISEEVEEREEERREEELERVQEEAERAAEEAERALEAAERGSNNPARGRGFRAGRRDGF